MVDALGPEHIERGMDIGGRSLFARMGDPVQAQLATALEHPGEFFGRVPQLARVQSHPDEMLAPGQGLLQRGKRVGFAQMPQEAQDERGADAQSGLGIAAGARQPQDHRLHGHATAGVRLWVEKQLRMHHLVGSGFFEISPGHVVKVLLLKQHTGAGVVDVQKALQVGEGIGCTQGLDAGIRQAHAIALSQLKNHLRLERALDVNMQFGFGHGPQHGRQPIGGNRGAFHQQTPKVMFRRLR